MRQPSDCSVRFWLALGVTIFLIALGARCVQGADLEVRVYKFNSTQVQGRRVTMTLLEPGPVVAGPWLIPGDAVAQYTDTTGVTVFSNVLAGAYRLDIAGSPSRSFPLTVPDTNALLNVADLINNTNGTPSFYTSAQVDALLENLPTTGGTTGVDTNTVNVLALQAARTVVSTNPIPATNVSGKVSAAATADTATSVPLASVTGRGTLDEWALLNPLSFVPPGAGVDTNAVYSIAQQVAQTNIVPATNISGKVASASAADTASTAATATNAVTAQQLVPVPNGTNILSLGPTNGPADMWIGLDHIVDFSTGVNLAKGFGLTLAGTPQLPSWLNYLSNAIATLPPGTNGGTTFQQSPSGHWFEVVNTNTQVAVMGVTSNDVTFANLGLATNLPRAGVVGQVAKDSEQDGRLDALEAGGGGGGSATNVFEVQWSGTATNNTFEPVLTNMVAANHTHAGTAWVRRMCILGDWTGSISVVMRRCSLTPRMFSRPLAGWARS
jgi:hypothetical protein